MLIPLNVSALECDTDLGQSLYANSAKFHKSCQLRFAQVKLDRAISWSRSRNQHPLASKIANEVILYLILFHKKLPHYSAFKD